MSIDKAEAVKRLGTTVLSEPIETWGESSNDIVTECIAQREGLTEIRATKAIEQEFGFQFNASDIEKITSVSSLVDMICAKATKLPE